MACGKELTPLVQYSKKSQINEEVPMFFPMYTVPLATLLEMIKIEPHEHLKAKGELVEFDRKMGKAAFISHQWVSPEHPDPSAKQMRVLQEALKSVMKNMLSIPPDVVSEINHPSMKALPASKLLSEPLFFWYDYFSIPQMEQGTESRQLSAINSIPAYVDQVSFFFALVPVIENPKQTNVLSPATWQQRGWCRLERSVRELSQEPSWIMVKSAKDVQLVLDASASFRAGSGPVGAGTFTVEADCKKLGPVLMTVLKRKLMRLLKAQDFPGYRALLNQQSTMLTGMACDVFEPVPNFEAFEEGDNKASPWVQKFFYQNGFRTIWEKDHCGWLPIHYAALNGDPSLVNELLMLRADPNQPTKKAHRDLGFEAGTPPLSISCLFKNNEVVQVLLSHRASLTSSVPIHQPLNSAAASNNAEAIEILCNAGCCPLQRNALGHSVVETAASFGLGLEAMETLLKHVSIVGGMDAFDPTPCLHLAAITFGGAEVVHRLVAMKADVNAHTADEPAKRTAVMRTLYRVKVLQHRFHKVSEFLYHAKRGTPLIMALVTGNYEFAAALIAAGAQLHLRNARGKSAADFLRTSSPPDFLMEALEGEFESCRRVSLLARDWVVMKF